MSSGPDITSGVLRHERSLIIISLVAFTGLSWLYLTRWAPGAASMPMASMYEPSLGALVLMWWLMMVAMMLPSATPTILLYSRVRRLRTKDGSVAQTWVFLAGYLAIWLSFSVLAAIAQRLLTGPSMALNNRIAGGGLLIASGVYQLSPLKTVCMRQCRSPGQFLSRYWRPGTPGAVALGIRHGVYCLGCCWMLMTLLFVGGIMNLAWIILLAVLVASEKLMPHGALLARVSGLALVVWGMGRLLL